MFFKELSRMNNGDRAIISPHAKVAPKKVRRAKARQASLEVKSRNAAANQSISTIKQAKKFA